MPTTLLLDLFPPPPILKTSAGSDHGLLTTVETNQFVTCHACMNLRQFGYGDFSLKIFWVKIS